MIRRISLVLAVCFSLFIAGPANAKGSGGSKSGGTTGTHVKGYVKKDGTAVAPRARNAPHTHATKPLPPPPPPSSSTKITTRDAHGRIARSESEKHEFERQTGYPHGRPGYVVDHIRPLACGGADAPSNMQWQTVAAAKAKDKVERKGC
jgi:hypothetical protein